MGRSIYKNIDLYLLLPYFWSMKTTLPIQTKTHLAGPALKAILGFSAGIIACRYCELDPVLLVTVLFAGIIILFASLRHNRTGEICTLLVIFFFAKKIIAINSPFSRFMSQNDFLCNSMIIHDWQIQFRLSVLNCYNLILHKM